MEKLILKPGKDKPVRQGHPWVFSGAVKTLPNLPNGSLCSVYSDEGEFLGQAYMNRKTQIQARIITRQNEDPIEAVFNHLKHAKIWRDHCFSPSITNVYRLVNAEGDGLGGLIIDRYDACFVIQVSTLGMANLLPHVLKWLQSNYPSCSIIERSYGASRQAEGLADCETVHSGSVPSELLLTENGIALWVTPGQGQKTGFFCDQREMGELVKKWALGRTILNAFSYTGAFSAYALEGGAQLVTSLDSSAPALALAARNAAQQGKEKAHEVICADAFDYLRQNTLPYDFVILDPPAFAKKKADVNGACRGYKEINRTVMQKLPSESLLLTCSCSYHISADLFQQVIFQAALEAGRSVQIIGRHRLAVDHPLHLFCPEGDYLKSLFLRII